MRRKETQTILPTYPNSSTLQRNTHWNISSNIPAEALVQEIICMQIANDVNTELKLHRWNLQHRNKNASDWYSGVERYARTAYVFFNIIFAQNFSLRVPSSSQFHADISFKVPSFFASCFLYVIRIHFLVYRRFIRIFGISLKVNAIWTIYYKSQIVRS